MSKNKDGTFGNGGFSPEQEKQRSYGEAKAVGSECAMFIFGNGGFSPEHEKPRNYGEAKAIGSEQFGIFWEM